MSRRGWFLPEVREITRIGKTYWAYGSDETGAGAIWKSDNLEQFSQVLTTQDLTCCRLTGFRAIVDFNGIIVAGGTADGHTTLVFSKDRGMTWFEVDDPAFTTAFHRLDALYVAGDTLVAEIYEDECCSGPVAGPVAIDPGSRRDQ